MFNMKIHFMLLSLIIFGMHFVVSAETVDLNTFETLSAAIKSKQNLILQDETPLKVILQYSQPQRKIQTNSEVSESALGAE